jgi:hypothetical protein
VLTLAVSALLFVLLAIFSFDSLVLCIAGYMIPAYFTYLAMESHHKEGEIRFLVYWAAFSLSEILNPVGVYLLGKHLWVILRVGMVTALINPKVDGAYHIYKKFLEPLASQLPDIPATLKEGATSASVSTTPAAPTQPAEPKKTV